MKRRLFCLLLMAWLGYGVIPAVAKAKTPIAVFDHLALYVADLDRSVAFYRDTFGFTEVPAPFAKARWMRMGGGVLLHVVGGRTLPLYHPRWIHFAVTSPDMRETIARLDALGVGWSGMNGQRKVQRRPDGVSQIFVQDPDGYWIEVNDARQAR